VAAALVCAIAIGLLPSAAFGATSTVQINLNPPSIDPPSPAVNTWGHNAVLVSIGKLPAASVPQDFEAHVDIPTVASDDLRTWASLPAEQRTRKSVPGANTFAFELPLTLRFLPCHAIAVSGTDDALLRAAKSIGLPCNFGVWSSTSTLVVYAKDLALPIQIRKRAEGRPGETVQSVVLQVENDPWFVDWSAGFSFLRTRDERYRVDPIEGEDDARLVKLKPLESKYEFASFAHYLPYQLHGSFGAAIGLSTKLPADSLNIALGLDIRLRAFPSGYAGYLTIGAAYAKRDRLHPDFQGLSKVPKGLSSDRLVEGRYGVVPFVSLTFGFLGGEKEFKGVYSKPDGVKK
jgi:hypothetical protein